MFRRLEARAKEVDSLLCVGLDPHPEQLSEPTAAAAKKFCLQIIEQTARCAAAFKPNIAFFEAHGGDGWGALADVVAAVPDDIPVIVDAKRGDIGSTAAAYATAIFDGLGADAVTLSPYLGAESIQPFLRPGKGVFVLARTSNPGGAELQDAMMADGKPLFEHVVASISGPAIGYVVGATAPDQLASVRRLAPDAWILAPGIGAQGADLERAVAAGKRPDGSGLLVPVSRAIAGSDDPGATAETLRTAINSVAAVAAVSPLDRLALGLFEAGCVQFGEFTLKSGVSSPIYIDLRRLASRPDLLRLVAAEMAAVLASLTFDHIAALPYAALPIGTAISLQTGASLVYPRREAKEYGTRRSVEGVFAEGDSAVVVDDLATSGGTKIEAVAQLAAAGLVVTDIVVLIDRLGGASEALTAAGYGFNAVISLRDLVDRLLRLGAVDAESHSAVIDYLGG
ncbi:MAG: orotidine-5'-phosphate decarboxylase [Acidimicrobiia bacterium]|nr:orotidine-5'-phosphate decarboxylase [Acidimicrobiia bacterium]